MTADWTAEAALAIAALAIIAALWAERNRQRHDRHQQEHDKLSVRPILEICSIIEPRVLSITLKNCGLGPALVKEVVLSVGDKPIESNSDAWVEALLRLAPDTHWRIDACSEGGAISPGATRLVLEWETEEEGAESSIGVDENAQAAVLIHLSLLRLDVTYESMYGDAQEPAVWHFESSFSKETLEARDRGLSRVTTEWLKSDLSDRDD